MKEHPELKPVDGVKSPFDWNAVEGDDFFVFYGELHGTTNYGFLYIAQGIGSVLGGPVAALLHDQMGTWVPVFYIVITLDILTALLALLALKPLRERWFGRVGALKTPPIGRLAEG